MKSEFEISPESLNTGSKDFVTGILKKSEHLEMRAKQLNYLRQAEGRYLIDLEILKGSSPDPQKTSDLFYIEEFINDNETFQKLYPYPSSKNNYIKPYLTPRKHFEYASFWGLTTILGLNTMRIVVKRLK